MIINRVQNQLECLYGIGLPHRADEYLIQQTDIHHYINHANVNSLPKELFLVRHDGDQSVEVALYLDPDLLSNLANNNPFNSLNDKNLSDFCILIEGVSHFVYYLWKTAQALPITQLEMELQAEIDKFLMFLFYTRSDVNQAFANCLLDLLFEDYSILKNLSEEDKGRYETASRLAAQYCYRLQKRFDTHSQLKELIREIRDFYHLNQKQKIEHILV